MRHDGEQPAALQPSALAPTAPNSEPDRFSRARQEPGMENNSGCLRREGVFIDPDFCDERCALRNLFGLAISPVGTEDTPCWLVARPHRVRSDLCDSPSLTDCIGRVRRTALYALWRDNLHSGQALQAGRHAGQDYSSTSALWRGERTVLCRARACAPVAYRGPGRASRTPEQWRAYGHTRARLSAACAAFERVGYVNT